MLNKYKSNTTQMARARRGGCFPPRRARPIYLVLVLCLSNIVLVLFFFVICICIFCHCIFNYMRQANAVLTRKPF